MRFKPSTIISSEFKYLDSYDLGGKKDPAYNLSVCHAIMTTLPTVDNFKTMGKCSVCGTQFRYGEIWLHEPSGLVLTVGHTCAQNYGLVAEDADYNQLKAVAFRKHAYNMERRRVRREIRDHLKENPSLVGALRGTNPVITDLRAKLIHWGTLTPAQILLAEKVNKKMWVKREAVIEEEEDPRTPVLRGHRKVIGKILGVRWVPEGRSFSEGATPKMLVEIKTPEGCYHVYGSMPRNLRLVISGLDEEMTLKHTILHRSLVISFTATFKQSTDEPEFGTFTNAINARLVSC